MCGGIGEGGGWERQCWRFEDPSVGMRLQAALPGGGGEREGERRERDSERRGIVAFHTGGKLCEMGRTVSPVADMSAQVSQSVFWIG